MQLRELHANGLTYRVREHGAGMPVLLLHGFPETSRMWEPLMEHLAGEGFHCLAPDQRGYSPGARPDNVAEYDYDYLANDAVGFLDAMGWERAHLIGHDWGALAGWAALDVAPARFLSWVPMSVPHGTAFGKAIRENETQKKMSEYINFFRRVGTAETVFAANDYAVLRGIYGDAHPAAEVDEYIRFFSQPGALTGGFNWYRATEGVRPTRNGKEFARVSTPTVLVWGKNDVAIGRDAVEAGKAYMTGPYELLELDCSHWIVQEAFDQVAGPITAHLKKFS